MGACWSTYDEIHDCDIKKQLDERLEEVSPHRPLYQKLFERFRAITIISSRNPLTKEYFRSGASILAERQRHNRSGNKVVIHPLSIFCHYRQRLLILLWMAALYKNTFSIAYYPKISSGTKIGIWEIFDLLVDGLLMVDIVLNFFTGYIKSNTMIVVLSHRSVVVHYLFTFFIFEVLGTLPFELIVYLSSRTSPIMIYYLSFFRVGRFVRLPTMLQYMEDWGHNLRLNASLITGICQTIMTVYYIHWTACILYMIPCVQYYNTHNFPSSSWVSQAQILPFDRSVPVITKYLHCLLCSACHFFSAGIGMYNSTYMPEQIFFSVILILGSAYVTYLLALVIQVFGSVNASESKYEELLYQLHEYMRSKKLPNTLKQRLMLYYENKFQKYYFKEEAILSNLPEHLRYEVFLHNCRSLILKVNLFQGLSKTTVGSVIGFLKPEVYLPGDPVARYGEPCEDVWFISYGTIAMFKKDGTELGHLKDGDYFGGTELSQVLEEKYKFNACAIEITELFRMSKKDFKRVVGKHRELRRRLLKFSEKYLTMFENIDDLADSAEERKNILMELRKGRILEKPKVRK